jgi:hypothetical protein
MNIQVPETAAIILDPMHLWPPVGLSRCHLVATCPDSTKQVSNDMTAESLLRYLTGHHEDVLLRGAGLIACRLRDGDQSRLRRNTTNGSCHPEGISRRSLRVSA